MSEGSCNIHDEVIWDKSVRGAKTKVVGRRMTVYVCICVRACERGRDRESRYRDENSQGGIIPRARRISGNYRRRGRDTSRRVIDDNRNPG